VACIYPLYANPMLVEPAGGDCHVKPKTPALKLGIKNFDLSNIGLPPDFPKQ
jgi:hypothetical protein